MGPNPRTRTPSPSNVSLARRTAPKGTRGLGPLSTLAVPLSPPAPSRRPVDFASETESKDPEA